MMAHELLNREELAARFGKDVRTITNYVQEGMPQRSRSGKTVYSWPECRDWWESRIREDARATRHAGGDEDRKTEMAELRLRAARAEAEAAELDLAERRGALVTLEHMTSEFRRMAETVRAALLAIPASWDGRLAGCTTSVERQLALQEAVNELLPVIGGGVDDDGEEPVEPTEPEPAPEAAAS
jgi:phage terminase Nu1 subunit (DNA packaging protein)